MTPRTRKQRRQQRDNSRELIALVAGHPHPHPTTTCGEATMLILEKERTNTLY